MKRHDGTAWRLTIAAGAALGSVPSTTSADEATFISFADIGEITGISADGSLVCGRRIWGGGFLWNSQRGAVYLWGMPEPVGVAIDAEGWILVAGNDPSAGACLWTGGMGGCDETSPLPRPGDPPVNWTATALGSDGSNVWVAGYAHEGIGVACRYQQSTHDTLFCGPHQSRFFAVSDHGQFAGTFGYGEVIWAMRYADDSGLVYLASGLVYSSAEAVSRDGRVVGGTGSGLKAHDNPYPRTRPLLWDADDTPWAVPPLAGHTTISASVVALNQDGTRGGGPYREYPDEKAFLWDVSTGTRDLAELLATDFGLVVSTTGWLSPLIAMSANGQVLVGSDWMVIFGPAPAVRPSFTTHLRDLASRVGHLASFSATAVGDEPLAYQWFLNDLPVHDDESHSGASTPSLWISPLALSDFGTYRCRARNAVGSGWSCPGELIHQSHGDLDHDGDVDQFDFGFYQACWSDPKNPACADAATIDMRTFRHCFSGPNVPFDPDCLEWATP